MRTMIRAPRATRTLAAPALIATALLSVGCSNADEPANNAETANTVESDDTAGADDTVNTVTVTENADADNDSDAAGGTDAAVTEPARNGEGDCASLPNDPHEMYPSGTAPGRLPATNRPDFNLWINDIDNAYDPCAEISWIIFRGELGDDQKQGGTASSITDGLALYVNGQPDGDVRPFTQIESLSRGDDGTITLNWGELGGATVEGITEHYSVTLKAEGGHIVPVDGNVEEFNRSWTNGKYQFMLGHNA